MENHEIAKVLDEVADMLEVSEDNFFRVRAYRNAARTIRDFPTPLARMNAEELQELPGIGAELAGKITGLIKTGELQLHRQLSNKVPAGLVALTHLPGLGPKRVRLLSHKLRIRDLKDLKRAIEGGRLRAARGFGPKICDGLAAAIIRQAQAPKARTLYPEAAAIANQLVEHLRGAPGVARLDAAGSLRRRKETVGDLDIVAAAVDAAPVMDRLVGFSGVKHVLDRGATKTNVVLAGGFHVDLRVVSPESYGAALLYFTGSQAHDIHLRRIAQEREMLLTNTACFAAKARRRSRGEGRLQSAWP